MRRILAILLLVFTFFLGYKVASAQDTSIPYSEIFGDQDVPGVTCGDSSNENIKRCCRTDDTNTSIEIEDPRFWCIPFGGPCASSLPIDVFEKFIGSSSIPQQIDRLNQIAKQTGGCVVGTPEGTGQDCTCKPTALTSLCVRYFANNPSEATECLECTSSNRAVWTGLGCIKVGASGLVSSLMSIGLAIAGLAALLCIIYSAFLLQISAGNPDRIKKARSNLTNCILGFLLILFSVFILRLIGVNILRIPGFS